MAARSVHPAVKATLEVGPILGFLAVYLIFRNESFLFGGTEYSGLVAITAAFVPVFLAASAILWAIEGRIARMPLAVMTLLIVFAGLGFWFNDPTLLKIKPTVIYLSLAIVLGIGLLRGQSFLQLVMDDVIPLRKRGWMRLTRRLTVLFLAAAAANELVWRTQTEAFWVVFETLVMPIVIGLFFLTQIPLFVENASAKRLKPREHG